MQFILQDNLKGAYFQDAENSSSNYLSVANRFVLGRQILDSIMMVHVVIHSMEAEKREDMLLKLDLSKAYDQVDWSFLDFVL